MKVLLCSLLMIVSLTDAMAASRKRLLSKEDEEILQQLESQKQKLEVVAPSAANGSVAAPIVKVEAPVSQPSVTLDPKAAASIGIPVKKAKTNNALRKVYVPAPPVQNAVERGFLIERDSPKIVTKEMDHKDTLNIQICHSSAVTIALDKTFSQTLQTAVVDDQEFFESKVYANSRAVLVKLKEPISPGSHWESALRLVMQEQDKTYLINLWGVACPEKGSNPFPKIYYIKEKQPQLSANSKTLTPEDTIIQKSEGFPRINKNIVRVYDMVASANSDWVFFGIEIQYPKVVPKTDIVFKVLNNFQLNALTTKQEHLPMHSYLFSKQNGRPTLRFKLAINIDKNYVLENRYLYLMVLDKETKHYQYQQIDLVPYYMSLKKRGLNI